MVSRDPPAPREEEDTMAKGSNSAVYRVTEVIGTSGNSWEDAARNADKVASKSLRDLRIAEISKLDVKIENGKITQFRARLALSFKYDS
jgi:dodecin